MCLILNVRSNLETLKSIGSNFAFTMLLDKLNLDIPFNDFEDGLKSKEALHEFKTHRTKNSYTKAVYNETVNLINEQSNTQEEGVFTGKPYYLLTKNNDDRLKILGDEQFTKVYNTTCTKDVLALNDTENVFNAIADVVSTLEKMDLKEKLVKLNNQ